MPCRPGMARRCARSAREDAPEGEDRIPSAANTIANISLGYALGGGVRIWAQLINVLDEQHNDIEYWYESRLEGEPAAGVADRHFKPVEPRQMRAGLSYGL